jgi:hypothetical protein
MADWSIANRAIHWAKADCGTWRIRIAQSAD